MLVTDVETSDALADVEWPTLVFFGGLFIMVGGLVETGVIEDLSTSLAEATDGRLGLASMLLLGGSAVLSAIVDNIPYVATMSPVVPGLVQTMPGNGHALWWSLAFGADLGGNATAIGRLGQRGDARAGRAGRATASASGSSPSTDWSSQSSPSGSLRLTSGSATCDRHP